jgi:hypothetical protein
MIYAKDARVAGFVDAVNAALTALEHRYRVEKWDTSSTVTGYVQHLHSCRSHQVEGPERAKLYDQAIDAACRLRLRMRELDPDVQAKAPRVSGGEWQPDRAVWPTLTVGTLRALVAQAEDEGRKVYVQVADGTLRDVYQATWVAVDDAAADTTAVGLVLSVRVEGGVL